MESKIQTVFKNMPSSNYAVKKIKAELEDLQHYSSYIDSCRIVIERDPTRDGYKIEAFVKLSDETVHERMETRRFPTKALLDNALQEVFHHIRQRILKHKDQVVEKHHRTVPLKAVCAQLEQL